MGPGSLRRAIERKSPMLLHRSIRTGSSIFANYSATGRSLAHGLRPLKWREKRRCVPAERAPRFAVVNDARARVRAGMIHRADVLGRITADRKAQAPDQIAVSKCRIASIDPNHAMILPHDAEHARRMGWMCDRVVEAGGTGSPI